MTLRELIEKKGYTLNEYDDTIQMLCNKGVPKGCYQDYTLLMFVLELLTNLDREVSE